MSQDAEIDAALEAVITAARQHRVVLANDAASPQEVWAAYTTLNNASVHYDDLISRAYDEVTPWDCEYIEAEEEPEVAPAGQRTEAQVRLCVRHRRDYLVPNPDAVIAAAKAARLRMDGDGEVEISHLGQAVYALIDSGDGTVAALDDVEELEPGNGVLLINEVIAAGEPSPRADPEALFVLPRTSPLLYRLDELVVADEQQA